MKLKKIAKDVFKLGDFEKGLVFVSACIVMALYISKKVDKSPISTSTAKPVIGASQASERQARKLSVPKKIMAEKAETIDESLNSNVQVVEEQLLSQASKEAISSCLGQGYSSVVSLDQLRNQLQEQPSQEIILASAHHLESEQNRFWYKIEKDLISGNLYRLLIAEPDENDEVGFPERLSFDSYELALSYITEVNSDDEVYTEVDTELIFNASELLRAEIKTIDERAVDIKTYLEKKQLSCSNLAADKKCICLD